MGRLDGKNAVISGGASGIGKAAADRFRAEGANVLVGDINADDDEIVRCDVADDADIRRLAEAAQQRLGPVDIVFANAGIAPHHDTTAMTEEQWHKIFDIDVKGVWLLCRAFLPEMLEQSSGSIIITASQLGLVGYPGLAAYAAAKAAVINLARSLAAETGPRNVRVNALCPGPTLTPGLETWKDQTGDPTVFDQLAGSTLLGRLASVRRGRGGRLVPGQRRLHIRDRLGARRRRRLHRDLVSRVGNSGPPRVVTGGCSARTQDPTRSGATRGDEDEATRPQGPARLPSNL